MRFLVLITFLFLVACVNAIPGTKFTLVKNSDFGFGAAAGGSKTDGIVQTNGGLGVEVPGRPGVDNEFSLVDNVKGGAAFGFGGSIATGVNKNNNFFPFP